LLKRAVRAAYRYRVFFRDDSMAYILFIGYMRLSTHLVLRILSNPRIYIVVLLYKSLSNPNILIGLYRCYFFFSHELITFHRGQAYVSLSSLTR
jgi:hypothetical protein